MEPNPCIFELPDDAILHVMSFLEPQHVVGSMTASRELANVIESGSTAIWKPLVLRRFGPHSRSQFQRMTSKLDEEDMWYHLFKRYYCQLSSTDNLIAVPSAVFLGHQSWAREFIPFHRARDGEDDLILSCGDDQALRIWDLQDPKYVDHISPAHENHILVVEANQFFDPYLAEDIAFASGANDKAICLWTLDDDRKVRLVRKLVSHDLLIRSLRFIEKRTLVSCSHDGTIRLWDIKSGVCLKVIVAHVGQHVMDIYPITQRLLASCSGAGEVTVWDLQQAKALYTWKEHTAGVRRIRVVQCGEQHDGWDWVKEHAAAEGYTLPATPTVELPGMTPRQVRNTLIVTASYDSTAKIWSLEQNRCLRTIEPGGQELCSLHIHPIVGMNHNDAILVFGTYDNNVQLWSFNSREMHEVLSGPDGIVTSVRVIGDKIVASCTDRSVWSWEIVEKHKYEEAPSQVAVVIAREPPSKTLYIDLERNVEAYQALRNAELQANGLSQEDVEGSEDEADFFNYAHYDHYFVDDEEDDDEEDDDDDDGDFEPDVQAEPE